MAGGQQSAVPQTLECEADLSWDNELITAAMKCCLSPVQHSTAICSLYCSIFVSRFKEEAKLETTHISSIYFSFNGQNLLVNIGLACKINKMRSYAWMDCIHVFLMQYSQH